MAEYLQYQSHGRYVSPSSKPNPYSQVRARAPALGSQEGGEQGCTPGLVTEVAGQDGCVGTQAQATSGKV